MPLQRQNFSLIIYYSMVWTIAFFIFAIDLYLPLGVADGSLYASLVLIGLLAFNRKLMIVGAILGTILTISGYFLSPPEGEEWKVLTNRMIAILTIWMTAFICLKKQKVDIELEEIRLDLEKRVMERTQSLNETTKILATKNDYLHIHKDIAEKVNKNLDIVETFQFCLKHICTLAGAQVGHLYLAENRYSDRLLPGKIWYMDNELEFQSFKELTEMQIFESGVGLPGRVHETKKPVWIENINKDINFPRTNENKELPIVSGFAFPIFIGEKITGVMEFFFNSQQNSDDGLLELLEQTGIQIGRAFEKRFSEEDQEKLLLSLKERVKELTCMSEVEKLITVSQKIEDILCSVEKLIAPAWQFPDLLLTQIIFEGKVYGVENFPDTPWVLSTDIWVNGEKKGSITICYTEAPPDKANSAFLDEEKNLLTWLGQNLSSVASRLANATELENSNIELRTLYNKLEIIREEERARIAREIHDELGQALTITKLDLAWLKFKTQNSSSEIEKKLNGMIQHIDITFQELDRITSELRPHVLNIMGLFEAIRQEADKFSNLTGIQCEIHLPEKNPVLHPDLSTMIFRVIQETLTNIIKHSGATLVNIHFVKSGDFLNLIITDNGKGIEADRVYNLNSFGLTGMRERVKDWGGDFKISGTNKKGTEVSIQVPLLET